MSYKILPLIGLAMLWLNTITIAQDKKENNHEHHHEYHEHNGEASIICTYQRNG